MQLCLQKVSQNRAVEYAEFGDPAGVPAIFFHGFVGSVHQAAMAHTQAKKAGLRIIAPHRPGVGGSTALPESPTIAEAVRPMLELMHALKIATYAAIGVSGGAPYALAAATEAPGQVTCLALASPLGPVRSLAVRTDMKKVLRLALVCGALGTIGRESAKVVFARKKKQFLQDLPTRVLQFVEHVSPADAEYFRKNTNGALDMFVSDHQILFDSPKFETELAREIERYWHWGFTLDDVPHIPCRIWHGTTDMMVPLRSAEFIAKHLPLSTVTTVPGGHFALLKHLDQICDYVATTSVSY